MRDMLDDDDVEHAPEPRRWGYWLGAGVAVAGLLAFFLLPHSNTRNALFNTITTITLPPPPPPPKPPPPQPPKTPEPAIQPKTVTTPVQKSFSSHAAPHTPLTAMAGAGSNPYGLQQGNGSGDDTIGGGGDGQDWSSYSPAISEALQSAIAGDNALRNGQWSGRVRFWFDSSGVVTRAEMSESTGDPARDREIEARIKGRLIQSNLPADMPQPVTVAITSSST